MGAICCRKRCCCCRGTEKAFADPESGAIGEAGPCDDPKWASLGLENEKDAAAFDAGEDHEPPEKPREQCEAGSLDLSLEEQALLEKATNLVDLDYDIIKAEQVLGELEAYLVGNGRAAVWQDLCGKELFTRFKWRLGHFMEVGRDCYSSHGDWFCAYEDAERTQSIHAWIDPSNKKRIMYRVRAQIPTNLANVLAVANEVELLPEWNQLLIGQPKIIGRRTAHYMVLNYQMSVLGGMQKLDILNEVRRFTDVEGGFLAEYIESLPEGHADYTAPQGSFKRPKTSLRNMWVACGPDHTVLIQSGKLELPIAVTRWWVGKLASCCGSFLIGGLVKNSMRSTEPGNPWAAPLQEDPQGLYRRMSECIESAESGKRAPAPNNPNVVEEFDLRQWFNRRYSKRLSQC